MTGLSTIGVARIPQSPIEILFGAIVSFGIIIVAWVQQSKAAAAAQQAKERAGRARRRAQLEEEERRTQQAEERRIMEERRQTAIRGKYREPEASKIVERLVWHGETAEQLRDSLGEPAAKDVRALKTKTREVWKYGALGGNRYSARITLENGTVTAVEQKG